MITADGRSAVEVEIEQMQFTGLGTRKPVFGIDYAEDFDQTEDLLPFPAPSFITRWVERIFGLSQPTA